MPQQHKKEMFNLYHKWSWFDMQAALDNIVNEAPKHHREQIIIFLLNDQHFTTSKELIDLAQDVNCYLRFG